MAGAGAGQPREGPRKPVTCKYTGLMLTRWQVMTSMLPWPLIALNAEGSGKEPWILVTAAKGPPKAKRKAKAKPKVNSKDLVDSSDISSCSSSHSEPGSSDDSSS